MARPTAISSKPQPHARVRVGGTACSGVGVTAWSAVGGTAWSAVGGVAWSGIGGMAWSGVGRTAWSGVGRTACLVVSLVAVMCGSASRARGDDPLRYKGFAPDAQLTGAGGFALVKPLDNPFLGRVRAGLMYVDPAFVVSLGPTIEVGALARFGLGGELEITAGPRVFGNVGVARVDDARWMSHVTLGWFVFGLEWQHAFTPDLPRDALLFGVRLPLGLWWLRLRQKSELEHRAEAARNAAPRWRSRESAVKGPAEPSAPRPIAPGVHAAPAPGEPAAGRGAFDAARSNDSSAQAQAERRELVQASIAAAQRAKEEGDAGGEVLALARAYELSNDPSLALRLAAATEQLGRYVATLATLQHALRVSNPSPEQRASLETEAARVRAKLPHLRLTLEGASGDERVLIDGVVEPTANAGYDVPIDPGEHRLTVERHHRTIADQTWQAHDAELVRISLSVPRDEPAP